MKDDKSETNSGGSCLTLSLIGCGVVVVIIAALTCGGLYFGYRWGMTQLDNYANEFEEQGYERRTGQVFQVSQPIAEDTVFTGQVIRLDADVNANLAVMAQVCEVDGTVKGDMDFYGQLLHIKPGGVIEGDLHVTGAQVVNIEGVVKGEITGSYQTIKGNVGEGGDTAAPPQADRADEAAPTPANEQGR